MTTTEARLTMTDGGSLPMTTTAEARTARTLAHRELRKRLRALYFKRGFDDQAQERVGWLMGSLLCGDTGRMHVVVGDTHVGKSSVVRRALGRDPDLRAMEAPDVMPVLTVELSSSVNMVQLGREILGAAGYPLGRAMSDGMTWERVRQQLELRKVRVLWVDEAQHTIHVPKDGKFKDTQYVEYVTNKFKGLMKTGPRMSVILSGLPPLARFVERDPQVAEMGSFAEVSRMCEDDASDLWDVVVELASEARLRVVDQEKDPEAAAELAARLMHASRNAWGFALRLAIEAVLEAAAPIGVGDELPKPDKRLRLVHFATVYGRLNGSLLGNNPFVAKDWVKVDCSRVLQAGTAKRDKVT